MPQSKPIQDNILKMIQFFFRNYVLVLYYSGILAALGSII